MNQIDHLLIWGALIDAMFDAHLAKRPNRYAELRATLKRFKASVGIENLLSDRTANGTANRLEPGGSRKG